MFKHLCNTRKRQSEALAMKKNINMVNQLFGFYAAKIKPCTGRLFRTQVLNATAEVIEPPLANSDRSSRGKARPSAVPLAT